MPVHNSFIVYAEKHTGHRHRAIVDNDNDNVPWLPERGGVANHFVKILDPGLSKIKTISSKNYKEAGRC